MKQKPLWQRITREEPCIEIVRKVGYAGISYRDFAQFLEELKRKYGTKAQETANILVWYEGKFSTNVPPLTLVELTSTVRKLAFQLLGPAPDDPEYARFKSPEPFSLQHMGMPKVVMTEAPLIENIPQAELLDRLKTAETRLTQISPRSNEGKQLKREITACNKELKRRGIPAKEAS